MILLNCFVVLPYLKYLRHYLLPQMFLQTGLGWASTRQFGQTPVGEDWVGPRYSRRPHRPTPISRVWEFQWAIFENSSVPHTKILVTVWYTTNSFSVWETQRACSEFLKTVNSRLKTVNSRPKKSKNCLDSRPEGLGSGGATRRVCVVLFYYTDIGESLRSRGQFLTAVDLGWPDPHPAP